jgi:hypothetical protein
MIGRTIAPPAAYDVAVPAKVQFSRFQMTVNMSGLKARYRKLAFSTDGTRVSLTN